MATGITKTFSGTVSKYVSGYGQFDLYIQFNMTENYDTSTRKSDLVFSNFQIKAVNSQANATSYVGGIITVTVNGTVYTVFSAAASAGTYKATANGSFNPVLVNSTGAAWSYTLSGLSRDAAGKLSAAVAWDSITLNNYYSGFGVSVSGSETVTLTTLVASYTLSISAGVGSTIIVNRTSSPNKGADTGVLSNEATIYHGDILQITFTASAGYTINTHTVNNSVFTSGNTHTVSRNVSIVSTAVASAQYTLTIVSSDGATVSVERVSSSAGSIGALSNGATLYTDDELKVTFSIQPEYWLNSATVNLDNISNDENYIVKSDVTIAVNAIPNPIGVGNDGSYNFPFWMNIYHNGAWNIYVCNIE